MSPAAAVHVLDHDPDLAEHLDGEDFLAAQRLAVAREARFPRGPWDVVPEDFDGTEALGLLLIDGLLVRRVTVGHRTCAELLRQAT